MIKYEQEQQQVIHQPEMPAGAGMEIDGVINITTDNDWTLILIVAMLVLVVGFIGYWKYGKR